MDDDIIFNDADGSDKDLELMERALHTLHYYKCNDWFDPIFTIDRSEYAYGILYDDQKSNIRYSIILSENVEDYRLYDITMSKGKSWNDGPYEPIKTINIYNSKLSYQSFLVYDNEQINEKASIEKIIKFVNRYMNLIVFL